MKDSDVVNIYWCPVSISDHNPNLENDWRILYDSPQNLYDNFNKNRDHKGHDNFLVCPSVRNILKNTYYFTNLIDAEYKFSLVNNEVIVEPTSKEFLNYQVRRKPSITTGPLFELGLGYMFFADEPLVATFTSPFFHEPGYTKYGSIVPGEYDIGQWIRPYLFEVQCWDNSGVFKIKENEPIFYVRFNTDKKIVLHEFKETYNLRKLISVNVNIRNVYKTGGLLKSYYHLFNRSKMKNTILTEIKKGLVTNHD